MIYLDYQATTPVDPRVAERIHHHMVTEFGNPSSSHEYGHRAATAIQQAAQQVADLISATPRQIIWTSGATESINHIAIPNVPNSAVIARTRHSLAISTGSACNSGVEAPSHVLQALRLPNDILEGALRISLGKFTAPAEIPQAAEILAAAIHQIQQLIPA